MLSALQHAATDEKSVPVHRLLAAAYTNLSDPAAAVHLKWLADHGMTDLPIFTSDHSSV